MRLPSLSIALVAYVTLVSALPSTYTFTDQGKAETKGQILEDHATGDPSKISSHNRIAKRALIEASKRAEMLRNVEKHEEELWNDMFECVRIKVRHLDLLRRIAVWLIIPRSKMQSREVPYDAKSGAFGEEVFLQCRQLLGWTDDHYRKLRQLQRARPANQVTQTEPSIRSAGSTEDQVLPERKGFWGTLRDLFHSPLPIQSVPWEQVKPPFLFKPILQGRPILGRPRLL